MIVLFTPFLNLNGSIITFLNKVTTKIFNVLFDDKNVTKGGNTHEHNEHSLKEL